MTIDQIVALIVAIIGSGGISSVIASVLSHRKYKAETDQLRQQIEDSEADTKIKIDKHINAQLVEITERYRKEFECRSNEIDALQRQNDDLSKQVKLLHSQIDQLMSWVVYDSMRYQEWLENELLQRDPEIQFPVFRKPPKFVRTFMEEAEDAPNEPPHGLQGSSPR